MKLIKASAKTKFDETVEVSLNLNIDPRTPDQNVRGTVMLPNGTGKSLKSPSSPRCEAEEAKQAGPTSSAPKSSPRRYRRHRSSSIAASPRPT